MPFSMNFSKDSLSGGGPLPEGWYFVILKGFKPELTKNKDSVNLNPQLFVTNNVNPDFNDRKLFENLNLKFVQAIQDLVHSAGLEMEPVPGTEDFTIPGIFNGLEEHPDDPQKWEYFGPLTNKILEVEIGISEYNGKKSNKVRQYKCAVAGCTERHVTNLIRN